MENFLYIGLNAQQINKILKEKYKNNLNIRRIQKILDYFRKLFFIHYKLEYNKTLIGGFDNEGESKIVAIDESLFINDNNGEEILVLGGIETEEKKIRLVIKIRNIPNNINYTHERHNHGAGDFGFGAHSTSHIESLWSYLKEIITKIYGITPQKKFIFKRSRIVATFSCYMLF